MFDKTSQGHQARKPWRLRTRLAAGLGVLFVAIFGLIAFSHLQYLNERRDSRLEDMQLVSQTLATSFDGLVYDLESLSLSTAITLGDANLPIDEGVPPETQQSVNEFLGHLFDSHGLVRALFITSTDGTVVYDQDGGSLGYDLSDRDYIQALQSGEATYWSNGFPGAETGETVITHSRAIVNGEGETNGYFVVVVNAASLLERVPEGIAEDGHFGVIDSNGNLLLRVPDEPAISAGANVGDWPALEQARTNGVHLIRDEMLPVTTVEAYAALVPMDSRGWVVSYSVPSSVIQGASTDLFLRDMALLGAIVLAAFVVMWIFTSRLVQPLTRLTQVAGAISRGEKPDGELSYKDAGNAEVLLLAETMQHMRQSIEAREEQLKSQNQVLVAIERFGESLASDLDLDRSISAVMDAGVELVGGEAVQLLYREHGGRQRVAIRGPVPALALPEDHKIVRDVLSGAIVNVRDLSSGDFGSTRTSSGEPVARSVIGVPILSRTGEQEGALLLLRANPGAYSAQHERLAVGLARWANIVLENANLYAQSQEIVAELASSNVAKDEFLGIISHELRTPITTIYGGTLLLRLRRDSMPEQSFNDMIVSISEEAERLHHLVEDLLAIARTELVNDRRPVDVAELLQTVVADFGTTHRRSVTVSMPDNLPHAMGDSTYFRQVLTNLVSNADKYSPSELPIEVSGALEGDDVVVRVKDNGPGIEEKDLPHIFESFFRAKGASEKASGSGLGLTVCKRLIESLGGSIWAQNRPEGGLEVGFTLKAEGKAEETSMPAPVAKGMFESGDESTRMADGTPGNGHTP